MGRWLEARGRLDRPIASLTRRDLECMASNAISRFIVLSSERRTAAPDKEERDALLGLAGARAQVVFASPADSAIDSARLP